jgi:nicotinamide-nucleotide amidase
MKTSPQQDEERRTPPARLRGEIITIGDELNRGEIVDTNAAWLGERLSEPELGVQVRFRQGVNDEPEDLAAVLRQAASRSQVVVVSGGLGPTTDDLTVEVAASLVGASLCFEPEHERRMRERFAERNFALSPNNLRQVRVPVGATVLQNRQGLAPGFALRLGEATLFFMPGVPRELKPMFQDEVVPHLQKLRERHAQAAGGEAVYTARRLYRVLGLGESHVDHRLAGLLTPLPPGAQQVSLHYRLAFPEVLVTLIAQAADEATLASVLLALDHEVRRRLGRALYSEGAEELAVVLGAALRAHGATLSTAESCTGGMIGELLTAVPGSSEYYLGGVIAYANEVKIAALGVQPATLLAHGAVSQQTVEEMARGARQRLGSTYAVAVSGVAGPGGGTPEKPVGTVHVAVAGPDDKTVLSRKIFWPGEREQVRRIAAFAALNLVHKALFPERLEDATLRL